jgi:hypothetical protein
VSYITRSMAMAENETLKGLVSAISGLMQETLTMSRTNIWHI